VNGIWFFGSPATVACEVERSVWASVRSTTLVVNG
jgi:hypothetical protein